MTSSVSNSLDEKESSCRVCNKESDNKTNESASEKHSPSCTVISSNEDETYNNYPPEKIEKRRLSLDFFFGRRSSHGKLKINKDKRGSVSSTAAPNDENESGMAISNQRRRSSTRMEGNSDLVAWCFI